MKDADVGERARRPGTDWILVGILFASLGLNVVVGSRYLALSHDKQVAATLERGASVGTRLPPLEVEDLNGHRVALRYDADSKPTLMYVFSRSCVWCGRNLDNLRVVVQSATGYHVVGVSLDPTAAEVIDYLKAVPLPFPVYLHPTDEASAIYGLRGTPHTFVIASDGLVLKSWAGAYVKQTAEQIQAVFAVALPGLAIPGAARSENATAAESSSSASRAKH